MNIRELNLALLEALGIKEDPNDITEVSLFLRPTELPVIHIGLRMRENGCVLTQLKTLNIHAVEVQENTGER